MDVEGALKSREPEGPNKEPKDQPSNRLRDLSSRLRDPASSLHKDQPSNRLRDLSNRLRDPASSLHKDLHSSPLKDPKLVVAQRSRVHKGRHRDNLPKDPNKEVQLRVKDLSPNNLPEVVRNRLKMMFNNSTQGSHSLQQELLSSLHLEEADKNLSEQENNKLNNLPEEIRVVVHWNKVVGENHNNNLHVAPNSNNNHNNQVKRTCSSMVKDRSSQQVE